MKLDYEKPQVAVEYYELSQTIAACVTKIGLINSQCVIEDPDAPDMMKDMASYSWFTSIGCAFAPDGTQQADGICFHTSTNAAFTS